MTTASLSAATKRAFDVGISSLMLLAAAPILLVVALLVRLDSKGPILYSQLRTGLNRRRSNRRASRAHASERRQTAHHGKPFKILKFRSMRVDAEAKGAVWCKEGDPRVTRMGTWLRKTHLDELPQLLNILKGDMSLVGPRPERPEFITRLHREIPGYGTRLRVKPGLTGLAQTRHRSDLDLRDVKKKVRYDKLYIKKASLGTDLSIMLNTAPLMLGMPTRSAKQMNRAVLFPTLRRAALWAVALTGFMNRPSA